LDVPNSEQGFSHVQTLPEIDPPLVGGAALALPGCLVVIGPPAERVSRALEASSAEEHSEAADEASEEAGQAAEEGGEDDAVTENEPRLLS